MLIIIVQTDYFWDKSQGRRTIARAILRRTDIYDQYSEIVNYLDSQQNYGIYQFQKKNMFFIYIIQKYTFSGYRKCIQWS